MQLKASDFFVDLHFPACGIDLSRGFDRQPNRPMQNGKYARTTPMGVNVRAFDPSTGRARGGQRAALARYINERVSGAHLIQLLDSLTVVGYTAPGGGVQSSQSGRVVTLVAVSQGNIRVADAGATSWTTPTNGNGALNASGTIFSASNQQKLYFADGTNYKLYNPATNSVEAWVATAGALPVDSAGNTPRLIETWRGRTVQAGIFGDPHNWFMPKVGDPSNFDYAPPSPSAIDAVAGNNSDLGRVGDVITSLVPFSDDVLFFGGDHTLWVMRGDPLAGGQLDRVSDSIGMAWGRPWCKDPEGSIYFVSNRMGIYKLERNSFPQRVSQTIEQLAATVNTGDNKISLAWDDRFHGLHIFVTETAGPSASTHFFFEIRTGAWWTDSFANNNHNPLCAVVFDGNQLEDRVTLFGSWDGYVRFLDPAATKDDFTAIESSVVIGPLLTADMDQIRLMELIGVLAEGSGEVEYAILVGNTAEEALASDAVETGTWEAGRNSAAAIRQSAHAIYVKLTASSPWAMESIRAKIRGTGKVAARSHS